MMNSTGFDLWSRDYDKTVQLSEESDEYPFAGYKDVLNTVYGEIRLGQGKTVLDIGFGTGILSKRLYDEGVKIFGVDFSAEMVNTAKEKMPDARLYQFDFTKGLPKELEGQRFDFIITTYAIHHLTDEEKISFIKLLKTCLNANGKILIGDVAFETQKDMELCMEQAGDEWDDEEFYIVAEDLKKSFPHMEFKKISFCGGVAVI
ncbi:MAG: class I SAM-dependent methyltransferase [Ruminococcaceae bacterium]|nr:class I SAM-dependent methyltransferase [Oscillospiraceae bacterium]